MLRLHVYPRFLNIFFNIINENPLMLFLFHESSHSSDGDLRSNLMAGCQASILVLLFKPNFLKLFLPHFFDSRDIL